MFGSIVMDVNNYLHENIHNFNVALLETVFDVHNAGNLLDSNQVTEYLQNMEMQYTVTNIKQEPLQRELKCLYFIDLTECSSDAEDRMSSLGAAILAKGRKQKQKSKPKPKPRAKPSSEHPKECPKKRSPKTLSAKRQPRKRPTKKVDQIILVSAQTKDLSISE